MAEGIVGLIEQYGYAGIAALMLIENVFPPIPSELIMPFAGFVAAQGRLDPAGVLAAGAFGSLLGTLPWYWAGRKMGSRRLKTWARRHGRWLTISPDQIEHSERWFERNGKYAVLFGRLVPAVRTLISIPAGIAAMPFALFLIWSTLGTAVWSGFLTSLGYVLEDRYHAVADWLNPVSTVIVAACVLSYLYRVATFHRAG